MSKGRSDIEYEVGSGNVFADMDLSNPEEHLLKARLARLINKAIEEKNWTQRHTAEVLGITQPKVSDLARGRLKNSPKLQSQATGLEETMKARSSRNTYGVLCGLRGGARAVQGQRPRNL